MKVSANYLRQQFNPAFTNLIFRHLNDLVESSDFTMGAPMREFEQRFSAMVGDREIIAVNSGTEALTLALKAVGIGPDDEVITVPNTFYATVGAIFAVGAQPTFVDVDASHQMDATKLAEAISSHTKAVLPVWWGGTPPDWPAIKQAAKGLWIVEDACQGTGGSLDGQPAGTWGDIAAFSFHPIKTLNAWGDAGAVAAVKGDAEWLRKYRDHGKTSRDDIEMWGVNARMQTIQAIVLNCQLIGVESAAKERRRIASYMDAMLLDVPEITVPQRRGESAWRLYMLEFEDRDGIKKQLQADGIDVAIHYPTPLHLQPPGRALGYGPGDFPVCERQAARMLTIPCHQFLTPQQVDYMIERIRHYYGA